MSLCEVLRTEFSIDPPVAAKSNAPPIPPRIQGISPPPIPQKISTPPPFASNQEYGYPTSSPPRNEHGFGQSPSPTRLNGPNRPAPPIPFPPQQVYSQNQGYSSSQGNLYYQTAQGQAQTQYQSQSPTRQQLQQPIPYKVPAQSSLPKPETPKIDPKIQKRQQAIDRLNRKVEEALEQYRSKMQYDTDRLIQVSTQLQRNAQYLDETMTNLGHIHVLLV